MANPGDELEGILLSLEGNPSSFKISEETLLTCDPGPSSCTPTPHCQGGSRQVDGRQAGRWQTMAMAPACAFTMPFLS